MSLTPGALTYTANNFEKERVGYIGPANTASVKDVISLGYTPPKPTAVFSGVSRYSWKWTNTRTLTGSLTPTADAIFEVSVSVPVGETGLAALVDAFQAQVSEADFDTFITTAKLSF
jgi:hypothetical protein